MASPAEKRRGCMDCTVHDYHSHLLPEKISSERERFWDKILTLACNTCRCYFNYHSKNRYRLDDFFVQKLSMKLRVET